MSETLWQRLWRGGVRFRQRSTGTRLTEPGWPERIMDLSSSDDLHTKQGRSTCRCMLRTDHGHRPVYLKRYYRLPRWRGLLASLWPDRGWSPGVQEYQHLEWARSQGVPVPGVLAAGEYIGPWGRLRSFLAVEELTGMLPLHEAIPLASRSLEPGVFRAWKRGLVLEMARLTRELHRRRHFHKDLYLCHFFVSEKWLTAHVSWRDQVHLIDLHRLAQHRWTWRLFQMKDLAQLLFSSEIAGIDARDRLRFWRTYMGNQRRGWKAELLLWGIRIKRMRYLHHNRHHSAW